MSIDVSTHLQALYHSGQISGYIHSKLADGPLKTGWIEQGLLSKGLKGNLRDKHNQESLIIPADRFARLARDLGGWNTAALVIIGSKGLLASKFVAIVFGSEGDQSIIAFQIQKTPPYDLVQFLLSHVLGQKISQDFEEPNLDYVEQLRLDVSEGEVKEITVLSLPKGKVKMSNWMKETLLSPSSENIEVKHGTSSAIPKFAALVTRWLTGLELFKTTTSGISALVFIGKKEMDACLWDQPQRKASFITFSHDDLESVSRKYLTPLWIVPGESLEFPQPARQVSVEERKMVASTTRPGQTPKGEVSISTTDASTALAELSKRLDSLELHIKSSKTDSDLSGKDRGSLEILQTKLSETIERIEILSKRLSELEKRIRKIPT